MQTLPGAGSRDAKLSVVVPAYGDAESLSHLLEDLNQQDLDEEFEILVIDDGSPVAVSDLVKARAPKLAEGIRWFRKENGGGASARNYGAERAAAPLLVFVDQDLRIPRDFLRTHLEIHQGVEPGSVSAQFVNKLQGPSGAFADRYRVWSDRWAGGVVPGKEVATGVFEVHPVLFSSTNVSLPRDLFLSVGGFPVFRHYGVEDQALGLTLGRQGSKVYRTTRVYVEHVETRADAPSYLRRQRMGMAGTVEMIRRFPEVFGELRTTELHRTNGPLRLGREAPFASLKKLTKHWLGSPGLERPLLAGLHFLERHHLGPRLVNRGYDALLAAAIQAGWRHGLAEVETP